MKTKAIVYLVFSVMAAVYGIFMLIAACIFIRKESVPAAIAIGAIAIIIIVLLVWMVSREIYKRVITKEMLRIVHLGEEIQIKSPTLTRERLDAYYVQYRDGLDKNLATHSKWDRFFMLDMR